MPRNINITPGYILFVLGALALLFGGSALVAWLKGPPAGSPAAPQAASSSSAPARK